MLLIFSLVSGLAIALTVQLLIVNLGLALGLSILDFSPKRSDKEQTAKPAGLSLSPTHVLGFSVTLSAISIVFIAALVSTEFSELIEFRRGIIYGLIVWAVYWLAFVWLSTTTLTSVFESVLGGLIAGGKELVAVAKRATQSDSAQPAYEASERTADLSQTKSGKSVQADSQSSAATPSFEVSSDRSPVKQAAIASTDALKDAGMAAGSQLLSAVESQINLPSWQGILQQIIQDVDISDLEHLWEQAPQITSELIKDRSKENYLEEDHIEKDHTKEGYIKEDYKEEANTDIEKESSEHNKVAPLAIKENLRKENVNREPSASEKSFQKKLIAYCRYTSPIALTPNNLQEKITDQQQAKGIDDLEHAQIDVDAIATVINNRKALSAEEKRSLIEALHSAMTSNHSRSWLKSSFDLPSYQLPNQISNIPSNISKPDVASTVQTAADAVGVIESRVRHYIAKQDKSVLQKPQHIVNDLVRIVGSEIRTIPHPEQLPTRSQIKKLLHNSSWQEALAKRKDMTLEEIQQITDWAESSSEQAIERVNDWIDALQNEASQLMSASEEAIEEVRSQVEEQIDSVKEKVEESAIKVKEDVQTRVDNARRQSAIAAWWLFSAILLSGIAGGGAGWLAARY